MSICVIIVVLGSLSLAAVLPLLSFWAGLIEPNWLKLTSLSWHLPKHCSHLHGLRIVQISDLHMSRSVPDRYLQKIAKKIADLSPDLILFCGDFICRGCIEKKEQFKQLLNQLRAPLGTYAILGNHDYATYTSRNLRGEIDVIPSENNQPIKRALVTIFQALFSSTRYTFADSLQPQPQNTDLLKLLAETPVTLLHNQTHVIEGLVNIVGLGDLFAKQHCPDQAFANYNSDLPGLVLSHNPDTVKYLLDCPGDFIFCGHSHGPQIFLPWPKIARIITSKLSGLENIAFTRGLFSLPNRKQLYVSRGLGGLKRIRFCSRPEICCIRCTYAP